MSTTKYKQDLDVTGNITLSGNVTADGNVILGDADTDSITLNADITSNIVPDVTNTYDLGSTGKNWKDLFISNDITVGNNVVALQVATISDVTVGADLNVTGDVTANTATVVNLVTTNITATGSGTQTISAGANIELDATNRVLVTDTPFRLANLTTVERDAIASPVNGDIIYNTTDNKFQGYATSAWEDLQGSVNSVQQISGPGAISLATPITEITTTGTDSYTLADGVIGQTKIIIMIVDGGDATITPTTFATGTTITMADVNDNITLLYGANGWVNTANQGAIIT
jgi:hypothetical protein